MSSYSNQRHRWYLFFDLTIYSKQNEKYLTKYQKRELKRLFRFHEQIVWILDSTKPSLGGILQEGLSRPLTSLLSKNSPVFTLLQPSTLEEIVLKLLELLKPLLPFINILLQHVTEILIVVINNLGDFLDHLIAILNALLPDWKNILLQLVQTLLQLLNEILPQLRPLLKEVLKLVQGLLQFLFDGNLCDLDKVFDKVDQLLAI